MNFRTRLIVYYLLATLLTMSIIGFAALWWIEQSGIDTVVSQLTKESNLAQLFIVDTLVGENSNLDNASTKTIDRLVKNLSISMQDVMLYNNQLQLLGTSKTLQGSELPDSMHDSLLKKALVGDRAYIVMHNTIYFVAPIKLGQQRLGILEMDYELGLLNKILFNIQNILLSGAFFFVLLIMILSFLIADRVVSPINQLIRSTQEYANRNFSPIPITRSDEIGTLARRFNEMGVHLGEYINKQKKLVSNVSHELRTPLTAIIGYSEYLRDEVENRPDLQRAVGHLVSESNRLNKLVEELLTLSRIDEDREEFFLKQIDFSILVQNVIENLQVKADKYQIRLNVHVTPQHRITADEEKLHQVLVNLFDNAIKYSNPQGQVEINLFEEDEKVRLDILDEGIGIPSDEISQVFNRFYRCRNAKGTQGSGLGLSLSKEIILRHEGTLAIINREIVGAKVSITFPKSI